jgi:hypothetical protein
MLLSLLFVIGCPKTITRDAGTFELEIAASLARQLEAAVALHAAARDAAARGDYAACVQYAKPALLIDASAERQAERALFLAGLRSVDPGKSKPIADVSTICGEAP